MERKVKNAILPLYRMPDGAVVDLRKICSVNPIAVSEFFPYNALFTVHFSENMKDLYEGEMKWLLLERDTLIETWHKVTNDMQLFESKTVKELSILNDGQKKRLVSTEIMAIKQGKVMVERRK